MPYDGESVAASTSRASNAGRPPCTSEAWRMSGVLAKKFGRKNCGSSERVSSVMYVVSSALVVRQVK